MMSKCEALKTPLAIQIALVMCFAVPKNRVYGEHAYRVKIREF